VILREPYSDPERALQLYPENFRVSCSLAGCLNAGGLADLQTVFDPKKGAYRESSAENTDRPLTSLEPLIWRHGGASLDTDFQRPVPRGQGHPAWWLSRCALRMQSCQLGFARWWRPHQQRADGEAARRGSKTPAATEITTANDLYNHLWDRCGPCAHEIRVTVGADGKKHPQGEKNNLTQEQLRHECGIMKGMTWSFALRHMRGITVLDFDQKDGLDSCALWQLCVERDYLRCETIGTHGGMEVETGRDR
jgi:hypothetical protein